MGEFDTLPSSNSLKIEPFEAKVSDEELNEFKQLVRLSKVAPETFENLHEDHLTQYGLSRKWFANAKKHWETQYDWRAAEKLINSFPNFTAQVTDDDGEQYSIHFVGLFSQKPDAVSLVLLHGWPGSFLEFLGILKLLKKKYPPASLPYNVVVPSLPGYGYSSGPTLKHDFATEDIARIIDKLMVGLGLNKYVAQGGDIGSMTSRVLAVKHEACHAVHLNFNILTKPPPGAEESNVNDLEMKGLMRLQEFGTTGNAYAREHGTRPSTIGLALSASPVALLAWIGEKFLVWSDKDPSVDEILDSVTLYWFTQSFPRAIYPYRQYFKQEKPFHGNPDYYIKKPFGFSWFPYELGAVPMAWIRPTGNLVWHRQHKEGGHFAALERPDLLLQDIEDFIDQIKAEAKL